MCLWAEKVKILAEYDKNQERFSIYICSRKCLGYINAPVSILNRALSADALSSVGFPIPFSIKANDFRIE